MMPPRKKVKTAKTADAFASGDSRESKVDADATVSTTVAQRRGQHHVRGRRGGLEGMPNMPLDVLIEIFGMTHPRDLLSLARTNRDFRAFLMSKNSATLWKASRQQVEGLPDPPPHLSEPAYANLLFSHQCHGCLKAGSHALIITLFVRYCASCRSEKLTTDLYSYSVSDILRGTSMKPYLILCTANVFGRRVPAAHVPDMARLEQEWLALKDAKAEEKQKFREEREAYVSQCEKVAAMLKIWQRSVKGIAQAEHKTTRRERFDAVINKMKEEGWGKELEQMQEGGLQRLANLSTVKRPVQLTSKGWISVREEIIEFMEGERAAREAEKCARELEKWRRQLRARISALLSALHDYNHSCWLESKTPPSAASLLECAFMPDIRAILEDQSEDETTESITARLTVALPQAIPKWTDERKAEMNAMIRKTWKDLPTAVEEPLDLATTVLRCRGCSNDCLTFPALLHHYCLRPRQCPSDRMNDFEQTVHVYCQSSDIHSSMYKPDRLMILDAERYGPCLREIITLCGYDPDTATSAEMDAHCEVRLRCRLCATMVKQEIFTWRAAISHTLKRHWLGHHDNPEGKLLVETWDRLPEDLAASARVVEAAIAEQQSGRRQTDRCTRCTYSGYLGNHLSTNHKVGKPQENIDYFVEDQERVQGNAWMYATLLSERAKEKAYVDSGMAFFASF